MGAHIPVLLEETLTALAVKPAGRYVDGTLGRAGHATRILAQGGCVLGIDRDEQALAEVARLKAADAARYGELSLIKGCHGDLGEIVRGFGWEKVDGILLDLGVSSPQLDEAARGFSFQADGPLDMRMDRSRGVTAAAIVNTSEEFQLVDIFRTYGDEPQARRIAKAIVGARAQGRFETTLQLADVVARTVGRHGAHHPATRVFQALRMAVNDEIGELTRALESGLALLNPGGRFAVITFESITDRLVKRFFAAHAGALVSLPQGGARWEGALPRVKPVTRRAVTASKEEQQENPRSRSAKLRAAERL